MRRKDSSEIAQQAFDLRKHIYKTISETPGIQQRDLQRRCELPIGTLQHHISYLVRNNIIREEKKGKYHHYFSIDVSQSDRELFSILRQRSLRRIIAFIYAHQPSARKHIEEYMGFSSSTLSWHLKKLLDQNIICKEKHSYTINKNIEHEIVQLLITHKKSFLDTILDNIIEMWDV